MAVRVLGLGDLQKACDRTAKDLMEAEQPAELAAGEPIRAKWAGLVPTLDRNYQDSLVVTWLGKAGAAVGTSWLDRVPRDEQPFLYSKRLEFGTFGVHAQPSARPAAAAARQEALAEGAEPFRTVIRSRKARKPKGA
jgi:hypothetical protein